LTSDPVVSVIGMFRQSIAWFSHAGLRIITEEMEI